MSASTYTQQVVRDQHDAAWCSMAWAPGEFSAAVGYEHRDELGHNLQPDLPFYIRADYLIQYGEPFSGKVKVDEAYIETNIPVLKDAPAAEEARSSTSRCASPSYRNQGLAGTTGLIPHAQPHDLEDQRLWDVVDWWRFRGSQSRDARAGNFRELYYGQVIGAGGIFGYCGPPGSFQLDPCDWHLEGNPDLRPEEVRHDDGRLRVQPEGAGWKGLQLSVDYFRIKIEEAIQQANVRGTLDGCHAAERSDAVLADQLRWLVVHVRRRDLSGHHARSARCRSMARATRSRAWISRARIR